MLLLRSGAIRRELSLSPGRCLPAAMGPLVRVGTAASRAPLARRPVTLLLVPSRTVRYEDALSEKRNRRCIVAENPQREPEARPRRQHAEGRQRARPVRALGVAIQRCTVDKLLNLQAKAPARLREEIAEDYRRMIYGETREAVGMAGG